MSASRQVYFRFFAEAAPDRSAHIAAALDRCLASYGSVEVRESGTYWKIPEYLEFTVELAPTDAVSTCISHLQSLEPAGWSGDIWIRQPDGPPFLLPEIRWAWLVTAGD